MPSTPELVDDSWDREPTQVKDDSPTAPVVAAKMAPPAQPAPAPAVAAPIAPPAVTGPVLDKTALVQAVTAEVRAEVQWAVAAAAGSLQAELRELQKRVKELETRAAAAAPPAPARDPHAAAMARPAPQPFAVVPLAPSVDLERVARESPGDVDAPFDGARRKRRIAIGFTILLLVVFGALFSLLAQSYLTPFSH